jgi:glycine oxidase
MARPDVVIIGGGVMGCSIALALAEKQIAVTVLEKSVIGAEASSKAAGILGAQVEAHAKDVLFDLCLASRTLFPELSERLRALSGIDVEYRRAGVLRVATSGEDARELSEIANFQEASDQRVERLDKASISTAFSMVFPSEHGALFFPDDARIDPPRYLAALRIAAERRGATFRTGSIVKRIERDGDQAHGVSLEDGTLITCDVIVIAAGSWSALLGDGPLRDGSVVPARGQIVEVSVSVPPINTVVWGHGTYLSPRDDGRVLVGSTTEFVGFQPGVTAGAVRDLLAGATKLVPVLEGAEVTRMWSNFRPHTSNQLPLIGPSIVKRVLLATGHFRNGILLSPITANAIAAIVSGDESPFDLAPFAQK